MAQLRVASKEDEWREDGKVRLPSYFSAFGVENADSFFEKQLKRAEKDAERRGRRSLSSAETTAKEVLEDEFKNWRPKYGRHLEIFGQLIRWLIQQHFSANLKKAFPTELHRSSEPHQSLNRILQLRWQSFLTNIRISMDATVVANLQMHLPG
jgi:hypothetical protein